MRTWAARLARLRLVVAVVLLSWSPSGCAETGARVAADGPLHVSEGSAGAMTLQPTRRSANRVAVFGGLVLCTEDAPVTIERVEYLVTRGEPVASPVLRLVPPTAERMRPASDAWAPFSARRGAWGSERMARAIPGRLVHDLPSAPVDVPCGPPSLDAARIELLTAVRVAESGGVVDSLDVFYEADGRYYRVSVPWTYTLCGASRDLEGCQKVPR